MKKIIVTGANGFIGKNLTLRLRELGHEVLAVHRDTADSLLSSYCEQADFIFHLAGINRPKNVVEFTSGNVGLTEKLTAILSGLNKKTPLLFTSSSQAILDNDYGRSKRAAEEVLTTFSQVHQAPVWSIRLPNVFGKWCRPNYNSAIATFCYNIANDLPITVNDPAVMLSLTYIDDVITDFISYLDAPAEGFQSVEASCVYQVTLGEVVEHIYSFKNSRTSLISPPVGTGLVRALYATYLSHLAPDQFAYTVPTYGDDRGVFAEILKTPEHGQFSFFTAGPNITRGGHYHHTKNEKFIVLQGQARFGFKHMVTQEQVTREVSGKHIEVVETIPGWSHDITNIGDSELIVMLWANEIFDRSAPDTIAAKVLD